MFKHSVGLLCHVNVRGSEQWLANYDDVSEHVREIIPKDARVLIVGCGNSGLSTDMYDDGYR